MQVILGIFIGIALMSILQASRVSDISNKINYLKRIYKTNSKGKSDYDKGYAAGIKYSYTIVEEELQ